VDGTLIAISKPKLTISNLYQEAEVMANKIKTDGLLSSWTTEPEPRTEQAEKKRPEPVEAKALIEKVITSPFQRAKLGAGDMFLSAEVIPAVRAVN
jgi:hypothetical protein